MRTETREVKIVSLSIKHIKPLVRKLFVWLHKQLSRLEDWVLKELDKFGKWADKKLTERKADNLIIKIDNIIED